jgi:hypothetical protein
MRSNESPAPLAGGNRAGYRVAERDLDTTALVRHQSLVCRLRRQRQVERLCRTPRLVDELLGEIARHHGIADDIARRIDRYAELGSDLLRAVGGDKFPPLPLHAVSRDDS